MNFRRLFLTSWTILSLCEFAKEGNDKGSWYGWEIGREEQLGDANLNNIAKSFAESVGKGEVKVKYEEESSANDKTPF